MQFEKILFHTQFGEFAFNALKSVLALRNAGLKEVVLTFVIPLEEIGYVPYGGYLKEKEVQIRNEVETRFQGWQQSIAEMGIKSKIRIPIGSINAEILAIAEEEKVDLIVAGRKKRTPFEHVYVAGHILDILRRSTVPVLMGKYMVEFESDGELHTRTNDQIFRSPLIATDWSEPSANALRALIALDGLPEKIIIAHVIDEKVSKGRDESAIKALKKESARRLQTYWQDVEGAGLTAESNLGMGKTVPEILRISREREATMIVLGRTGKDWFEQYWLGGVSHRITELSELPVMIVP